MAILKSSTKFWLSLMCLSESEMSSTSDEDESVQNANGKIARICYLKEAHVSFAGAEVSIPYMGKAPCGRIISYLLNNFTEYICMYIRCRNSSSALHSFYV